MDILIKNIKGLVKADRSPVAPLKGHDLGTIDVLPEAFLAIDQGKIKSYGTMADIGDLKATQEIDASNRFVLPSFCDAHTHIVFAGSREQEFVDKIKGLSYQEIAAKGGGILNSAKRLQGCTEEDLFAQSMSRVWEVIYLGTGAIEIKSGYGLTTEDELKMLRVVRKIAQEAPVRVKATFLGAHAFPAHKTREQYIGEIIDDMIPAVASQNLAEYCDVFCEEGFFSPEESKLILQQGITYGLLPKVHANQLNRSGGVQLGVELGAISVDHLECIGEEEISDLTNSKTMATLLPGAAFFLKLPFPPARQLIEAGVAVNLASDYNPGSSPSGNMAMCCSFACVNMRMTPEESLNAATVNGAFAMGLEAELGTITPNKIANVSITKPIPSLQYIPYAFAHNWIDQVILQGKSIKN